MDLDKIKKIHFIGIGGIGISAIARLMNMEGKKVSGSDMSDSPILKSLSDIGIKTIIGQNAKNIPENTDLIIHTIAISKDNPEIIEAQSRNIKIATYPEMLSVISKNMKTVAVSGTHGKTTTTAMLSKIMVDAGLDPTVIVGSLMKDSSSNLIVGKSNYFLVEACEYRRSFLNLYPNILIITNIEEDHLDYYKDLTDIQSAFRELVVRVPDDGALICNVSDPRLKSILYGLKCKVINYSTYIDPNLKLKVLGEHNRQNAGACLAVANFLKIDRNKAKKSLEEFSGTWRRFDLRGKTKSGTLIYDDYAHHPSEIMATLKGMKEMYPDLRRVAFFQPHLFSRTKSLLDQFSKSFVAVDEIYVLPIYAAREEFDSSINSSMLVEKIKSAGKKAYYLESFSEALICINKLGEMDVVVNLGAGDIYKLSESAVSV